MNQYTPILKCSLILSVMTYVSTEESTMKTLSVVFRHGDRAPSSFYPKDPNQAYSIYPLETGDLNNQGKRREYQLGNSLRQRYNDFLGAYYEAENVFAISTDVDRTRMSLLLVLASLYPPRGEQIWKTLLNWQPVASYGYVPKIMDPILDYFEHCPAYMEEYDRVRNSPEFQARQSKFDDLMKNLTRLTGEPITTSFDVYNLYLDLIAEKSSNLRLPAWTRPYFEGGAMLEETLLEYELQSYNTQLKRLNGGSTIRKILTTIQGGNSTKVNLYSAHENNVAGLLNALNVWDKFVPQFSSAVLFEHHEENSQKFVKVIYYRGIPPVFEELTIPGCATSCPLENFLKITAKVIPDNPVEECFGPVTNSTLVPEGVNPVQWIYDQIYNWYSF